MTMRALLFQSSDEPFDHAVLLWAVRGDELLLEASTAHETRVGPRGKNEPVVHTELRESSGAAPFPWTV